MQDIYGRAIQYGTGSDNEPDLAFLRSGTRQCFQCLDIDNKEDMFPYPVFGSPEWHCYRCVPRCGYPEAGESGREAHDIASSGEAAQWVEAPEAKVALPGSIRGTSGKGPREVGWAASPEDVPDIRLRDILIALGVMALWGGNAFCCALWANRRALLHITSRAIAILLMIGVVAGAMWLQAVQEAGAR